MMLASRFRHNSPTLRSTSPLSDEQMRAVAPSIFSDAAHDSRSSRYTYIPTSRVLAGLREEGFEPFMVAQTKVRDESKRDFTKHMIRLRHVSQINSTTANECILLNSHDGSSSFQLLAGVFRFVCSNGLVCGETSADIRVRHQGDIVSNVIEGAYTVLEDFERIDNQREEMRGIKLSGEEKHIFASAALSLKYDPDQPSPITEKQIISPRRIDDINSDLWSVMNVAQENMIRGGLLGRSATGQRRRTRAVEGIDQNIKLNRALWMLADGMAKLKA
ncbi:hypothetical protein A4F85_01160 [Delftia sp. GW456-R20]|uniref:DUF932 domain-containing protein n=1 Tax=Delftia sp. GW456-R20 TaxID=1827145 RepID=UPI0007B4E9FD|nr:DUF932 domain-containing protein [Delftia sp. GW456-R20]KZK32396.1 hypothetical protein A4F85_01160 [Delftia sp. GW456-R20]